MATSHDSRRIEPQTASLITFGRGWSSPLCKRLMYGSSHVPTHLSSCSRSRAGSSLIAGCDRRGYRRSIRSDRSAGHLEALMEERRELTKGVVLRKPVELALRGLPSDLELRDPQPGVQKRQDKVAFALEQHLGGFGRDAEYGVEVVEDLQRGNVRQLLRRVLERGAERLVEALALGIEPRLALGDAFSESVEEPSVEHRQVHRSLHR